jgi:TPR repeat protein
VISERGLAGEADLLAALQLYRNAAALDDAEAKVRLARLYRDGKGVEQDAGRALALLQDAVDSGQKDGLRDLGQMKANGLAGPKDEAAALALYREAAETDPWAARDVAKLLEGGEQVERDLAAAIDWHRRAAKGGVGWSARDLARFYEAGTGVEQSTEQAVLWYATALASARGDAKLEDMVNQHLTTLPPAALTAGAQLLLQTSGYDVGVIDGQLGPATRAALERFQVDAGLGGSALDITPALLSRMAEAALDKS